MKKLRKIINTLCEVYSAAFDSAFHLMLGNAKPANLNNLYCNADYFITSGGAIVKKATVSTKYISPIQKKYLTL